MMECARCEELFSLSYDGELRGAQASEFMEHLRSCTRCEEEFARFTESLAALRSIAGELEAPHIARSVRRTLSAGRKSRAARWHQIVASDMRLVSERLRPARGGLIILATAAAAVLFVIVLATAGLSRPVTEQWPETVASVPEKDAAKPRSVYTTEATQEGLVRIGGEWVAREEALAALLREKGLEKQGEWFVPQEDAASLAMGLVRHADAWLTPEELARQLSAEDRASGSLADSGGALEREKSERPQEAAPEEKAPEEPDVAQNEPRSEAPKPTERPVAANNVAKFLSTVLPDESETHGPITVFTLTRQEKEWAGKGDYYMTLADAVSQGLATVEETGKVNKLLIKKKDGVAVFTIGGGIMIGGWQNRLTGPDVVLSRDATESLIEVYCAEKGRWTGSKLFSPAPYVAVAPLRRESYSGEKQDKVWKTIKALRKSQGIHLSNSSIHKLYEKRSIKKQIEEFEKAFAGLKGKLRGKPHTVGIAVLVNGRVVGADLFVNNDLLVDHFDQLIRTYAVEAVLAQKPVGGESGGDQLRAGVGEFLACAARSNYGAAGGADYLEYRISDPQTDLFGYALSAGNAPVHVSLFADGGGLDETEPVSRPPKTIKTARDKPADPKTDTTKKQDYTDEEAAAKLLKDGKLKPKAVEPPAPRPKAVEPPPKPKAVPVPPPGGNGNGALPKGRIILPR